MADFATHGGLSGSAPRPRPSRTGDVIANFFPHTFELVRDFASGEKLTTYLELRRLTAGKSRAVYDFQPTRQYLFKLSVLGGPGQAVPGYHSPGCGYPGRFPLAYAAKTWQVKDLGAYNLAVLEPFELGYKLGVLDLADWTP